MSVVGYGGLWYWRGAHPIAISKLAKFVFESIFRNRNFKKSWIWAIELKNTSVRKRWIQNHTILTWIVITMAFPSWNNCKMKDYHTPFSNDYLTNTFKIYNRGVCSEQFAKDVHLLKLGRVKFFVWNYGDLSKNTLLLLRGLSYL